MKFVFLSDTHNKHDQIDVPPADCFIYCGDMSLRGEIFEIENFAKFIEKLPHKHKVVIAGNHDRSFEDERKIQAEKLIQSAGALYLNDSGLQLEKFYIWGSPVQPWLGNWAFNRQRGKEIKKHWDLIPKKTDILVTHGPPYGILDQNIQGEKVGCEELLKKVKEIRPKVHAFGHIHEGYGILEKDGIIFINASNLNRRYEYQNLPLSRNL